MASPPVTILAIDDSPGDLESIRQRLAAIDDPVCRIVTAPGAREGLAAVRDQGVDLVFVDYLLGAETGLQFLARLRAQGGPQPVFLMTGQASAEIAVQAMKAGAEDYIVKSQMTTEGLRHSIINVLEKEDLRRRIEKQRETLLEAERMRVMVESIGAACHHFSQPLQSMMGYLQMMQLDANMEPARRSAMLERCVEAVRMMDGVLRRLQEVSLYRTVPYLDQAIIDIGEKPPAGSLDESGRSPADSVR